MKASQVLARIAVTNISPYLICEVLLLVLPLDPAFSRVPPVLEGAPLCLHLLPSFLGQVLLLNQLIQLLGVVLKN